MRIIAAASSQIWHLFVDDGPFATPIILWPCLIWLLDRQGLLTAAAASTMLAIGMIVILVAGAVTPRASTGAEMSDKLTSGAVLTSAPLARAMDVTYAYWFAMLAASALGTNLGDLWAEVLLPGRFSSLACLLAVCAVAVWYDRRAAARSEASYWVAIVVMRAAATNLADIITHDLAMNYVLASALLAVLTLVAARFTHPDPVRRGSPLVDGAYWVAMFIAGLFGTVAGDFIHHSIGLYAASGLLCLMLAGLIGSRDVTASKPMLLYWGIVMVERCAGTAVGDALASRRAVGLGVLVASACTAAVMFGALWIRAQQRRR